MENMSRFHIFRKFGSNVQYILIKTLPQSYLRVSPFLLIFSQLSIYQTWSKSHLGGSALRNASWVQVLKIWSATTKRILFVLRKWEIKSFPRIVCPCSLPFPISVFPLEFFFFRIETIDGYQNCLSFYPRHLSLSLLTCLYLGLATEIPIKILEYYVVPLECWEGTERKANK